MKSFPLLFDNRGLRLEDFSRFSNSYKDILKKRLPTTERVDFLHSIADLANFVPDGTLLADLKDLFLSIQKGEKSVGAHPECLMLPFAVRGGETVVALITNADQLFLRKVSEDWLAEQRLAVEREFLLLKEARVDIQTGLLNSSNLGYLLDNYSTSKGLHLILVELPPKRNSFQYATRHAQKCATALLNFFQSDTIPHHVGQCTFAVVLQNNAATGKCEVEAALVAFLKREGFNRIHVGSSALDPAPKNARSGGRLLDEAWTALLHAARRGPFSFCDYSLLANPQIHPLRLPDRRMVAKLTRLWRQDEVFTLVHFQSSGDMPAARILPEGLKRGEVIVDGPDVLVYLAGILAEDAFVLVNDRIKGIKDAALRGQLSAGICGYPFADFKKSEIPFNCRKALLHANFYGEPRVAVFDAVSMNISGDVYFGDGDLAKAVAEYKRGLKSDGLNVNLHNSLGVALAMMGKLGLAMQNFERALALDVENFMALYNLGLAEQARGSKAEAFAYFKKALSCCTEGNDESGLREDLPLQLGILAGDLGWSEESLHYLLPWYEKNARQQRADRVLYHLGLAYHGVGDNNRAMAVLQKALQFNEFDDRAMNLLGLIYLQENQGDDIALALCRKSVELEPNNRGYRLNLAEVQLRCRMVREARGNLLRCLRSRKLRGRAQLLLGRSYILEEKPARAKMWFEKVLEQEEAPSALRDEAHQQMQA